MSTPVQFEFPKSYIRKAAEGMIASMAHYGNSYPAVGDGRMSSPTWYVNMLGKVLHTRADVLPEVPGVEWHGARWLAYAEYLLEEISE